VKARQEQIKKTETEHREIEAEIKRKQLEYNKNQEHLDQLEKVMHDSNSNVQQKLGARMFGNVRETQLRSEDQELVQLR
jgi:hypothetical protein